jgi:hypothetical protein
MAGWYFDADDDNLLVGLGTQIRALDDRLYIQALLTNGNETQTANLQMDDLKGVNIGGWYDFGGDWDDVNNRWLLYGPGISDLEYHCRPCVRVGGAVNLVPMDRRSEFTDVELNRIRVTPAAPGGTTLLTMLNGGGINNNAAGVGQFAVDAADEYTFDFFLAGKYRGFSLYNEWWCHDIDNLRGRRNPPNAAGTAVYPGNGTNQPILYTSNFGPSLFPQGIGLFDYGMALQAGYFLIPKKLEVAARWSYIRGESGSINGTGGVERTFLIRDATGASTRVSVVNNAFRNFQETDEYAIGFNYFFKGQQVKFSTDLSFYTGGNPAVGGQSPAGFIPGVDGWMLRSQIQLWF